MFEKFHTYLLSVFRKISENFSSFRDRQLAKVITEPDLLLEADAIQERSFSNAFLKTIYLFVAFIVIVFGWSFISELDEVISARGKLVSVDPVVVVNAFEKSVVKEVHVRVGDVVSKGQLMALFDPTLLGNDESTMLGTIAKSKETIRLLESINSNLSVRLRSASQIQEMNQSLFHGGFISKREYLEANDKKNEAEKEYLQSLVSLREVRSSYANQLNELKKLKYRSDLLAMTSPADAVVLEVPIKSIGTVVPETSPFITLAPLTSELQVNAYIKTNDINKIKVGDSVNVKIDAYPYQKYGLSTGKILRITRDAVRSDFHGVPSDQDFYVAIIGLDVVDSQRSKRLLPGMSLSADIKIGSRSIISYLTYPIIRIKNESLNEKTE